MPHVRIPGPGDPWLLLQLSPPGSVPELKGRKLQLSAENKEEKTHLCPWNAEREKVQPPQQKP